MHLIASDKPALWLLTYMKLYFTDTQSQSNTQNEDDHHDPDQDIEINLNEYSNATDVSQLTICGGSGATI